jgi:5-methylcytosine-specific restriction endonuclease McrA
LLSHSVRVITSVEAVMSDRVEAKRVKSSALPWFITSRVCAAEREGMSEAEQACLALEIDGMPCPMDTKPEKWVRDNFSYICFKYHEKYPVAAADANKSKRAKKMRRQQQTAERKRVAPRAIKPRTVKVAGIDVTTDAFLSTYEWRKVRMEALKKHGPRCQCCGATPATGAVMNVDHIKPRKKWPSLALDVNNLQILCHECNHGKGNWDSTDWRS